MIYSYVYLDVNLANQNWWTLWLIYCLVIGPAVNIGVEVLVYKVRPLQKKDECKTYKWICILSTGFIYLYFVWFFWDWYVVDFLEFLFLIIMRNLFTPNQVYKCLKNVKDSYTINIRELLREKG